MKSKFNDNYKRLLITNIINDEMDISVDDLIDTAYAILRTERILLMLSHSTGIQNPKGENYQSLSSVSVDALLLYRY